MVNVWTMESLLIDKMQSLVNQPESTQLTPPGLAYETKVAGPIVRQLAVDVTMGEWERVYASHVHDALFSCEREMR